MRKMDVIHKNLYYKKINDLRNYEVENSNLFKNVY